MNQPCETVVVGAGVVGLSIAIALQQRGRQVTLLDRSRPGEGASFGNAGFLATELNDPLATPDTLKAAPLLWANPRGPVSLPLAHWPQITPWLWRFVKAARPRQVQVGQQGLRALNQSALGAWQRLLRRLDLIDELVPSGYLQVWEAEHAGSQAEQQAEKLAGWGIDSTVLSAAGVAELEPGLNERVRHGLLLPASHQVRDPYHLVQRLFERFMEAGGRFQQTRVTSVRGGQMAAQAVTEQGAVDAHQLVIACGAWSRQLLKSTGIDVPLQAERGYHLTLPRAGSVLRRPVGSADRHVVMTPMSCGLRVVGMSELGGLDQPPIEQRFDTLRHHASALLADAEPVTRDHTTWMGYRPTLPDSLPVIDQHPQQPSVYMAFGHQHLGLTQAAITSELLAARMNQQDTRIDLTPYRINRF